LAIFARRLALNLCGIHSILIETNRVSTSQPPICATRPLHTITLSLLQAATAGQRINLIFRPRRYQLTAASYRHARSDAFSLWADYTAEMAA